MMATKPDDNSKTSFFHLNGNDPVEVSVNPKTLLLDYLTGQWIEKCQIRLSGRGLRNVHGLN